MARAGGKALLPFGLDYADVLSVDSNSENHSLPFPINGPVSAPENLTAKQAIAFSSLLLDGPFYTGESSPTQASSDGIQRHSDKYKKTKKIGRTIEEHPYQLEFFPQELYSVMGISKKKLLSLSSLKNDGDFKKFNLPGLSETSAQSLLDKLNNMAETLDADPNAHKEDVEEEEEMEDDFEEEEDDDYNAEKYFDDGEDDGDDDGDDEAAF